MIGTGMPSATDIVRAIGEGRVSAERVVRAALDRTAAREAEIGAWVWIEPKQALAAARARDAAPAAGPLQGVPVGIKDIIDWHGQPTGCGSQIRAGHIADADAACLSRLRAAGAIPLGKTVTTEFATFQPPRTRNPHDLTRTPGGSSSGSAAAVAAGMVPLAIGSQTVGSVIRPAAFCGVVGFKPTHGLLSLEGVQPLAPGLDTIGCFATTVADVALWFAAMTAGPPPAPATTPPRIAIVRTEHWEAAAPAQRDAVTGAARRLIAAGADRADGHAERAEGECVGLAGLQDTIFAAEAAQVLAHEHREHRALMSDRLVEVLDRGAGVSATELHGARRRADAARQAMAEVWLGTDVILTCAAPGEAPLAEEGTGDPLFNRAWTLLRGPCLTLPVGTRPEGLPLGLQIVGAPGRDAELLAAAAWIETALRRPGR